MNSERWRLHAGIFSMHHYVERVGINVTIDITLKMMVIVGQIDFMQLRFAIAMV